MKSSALWILRNNEHAVPPPAAPLLSAVFAPLSGNGSVKPALCPDSSVGPACEVCALCVWVIALLSWAAIALQSRRLGSAPSRRSPVIGCVCVGGGARSPSLAHSHTHKQMHPISKDTTDINSSTDETEIKKNKNKKHSHGKPGDHSFSWGCLKNGRGCRWRSKIYHREWERRECLISEAGGCTADFCHKIHTRTRTTDTICQSPRLSGGRTHLSPAQFQPCNQQG